MGAEIVVAEETRLVVRSIREDHQQLDVPVRDKPAVLNAFNQRGATAVSVREIIDRQRGTHHRPMQHASVLAPHRTFGSRKSSAQPQQTASTNGAAPCGAIHGSSAASRLTASVTANCPGRKPPFWAIKRPARPYKSHIQNVFS